MDLWTFLRWSLNLHHQSKRLSPNVKILAAAMKTIPGNLLSQTSPMAFKSSKTTAMALPRFQWRARLRRCYRKAISTTWFCRARTLRLPAKTTLHALSSDSSSETSTSKREPRLIISARLHTLSRLSWKTRWKSSPNYAPCWTSRRTAESARAKKL